MPQAPRTPPSHRASDTRDHDPAPVLWCSAVPCRLRFSVPQSRPDDEGPAGSVAPSVSARLSSHPSISPPETAVDRSHLAHLNKVQHLPLPQPCAHVLPLEPTTPSSWHRCSFALASQHDDAYLSGTKRTRDGAPTSSCSTGPRQHRDSSAVTSQSRPAGSPSPLHPPRCKHRPTLTSGALLGCTKPKTLPAVRPCGRFRLRFGLWLRTSS